MFPSSSLIDALILRAQGMLKTGKTNQSFFQVPKVLARRRLDLRNPLAQESTMY